MIAAGHTSVGVIVGIGVAEALSPLHLPLPLEVMLVGMAGWASHYAMDVLPHGHYDFNQQNLSLKQKWCFGLDFGLPIVLLAMYLWFTHGADRLSWLIGTGVLGAQLPDLLMGLRSKQLLPDWPVLRQEARFHHSTHWHNPTNPNQATAEGGRKLGWSDAWQMATTVVAVMLLLNR
jgi:hypothetical protein